MTAPKPATSLPWKFKDGQFDFTNDGERYIVYGDPDTEIYGTIAIVRPIAERKARGKNATLYNAPDAERDANAAYIVHAANAYPQLVAALRDLMLRCDGDEGVRADGSNIQTYQASALLQSLGEL